MNWGIVDSDDLTGDEIIAYDIRDILDNTSFSLAIHRTLSERFKSINEERLNIEGRLFWVDITDNSLMMTAINWCKVFGSEKNNRTHYKRLKGYESFERMAFDKGYDLDQYSKDMREFRDKFIAHKDNYRKTIPNFDTALDIMEFFYETVLNKLEHADSPKVLFMDYKEMVSNYLDSIGVMKI